MRLQSPAFGSQEATWGFWLGGKMGNKIIYKKDFDGWNRLKRKLD
jgi:hypothetical protein